MERKVRSNRGISFIEILLTLAIVAILGTVIYPVFSGSGKVQLTRCHLKLGEMTAASTKYDQLKTENNANAIGDACQKLNKIIEEYKKEECANLIMVIADKKCSQPIDKERKPGTEAGGM